MDSLVPAASRLLAAVFDPLASLARGAGPLAGIALFSAPAGILMAEAVRLASPRNLGSLLRSALSRMAGMLLHVQDPLTVAELALSSLWRTLVLLLALAPPVLLASLPFSVVYGQIRARFGLVSPRGDAVVTVGSDSPVEVGGDGVIQPVVRGSAPATASFRIARGGPGDVVIDGFVIETGAGAPGTPVTSRFTTEPVFAALLDPSIRIVEDAVNCMDGRIGLVQASYEMAGMRMGWLAWYVVLSSLAASAWLALASALKKAWRLKPCIRVP